MYQTVAFEAHGAGLKHHGHQSVGTPRLWLQLEFLLKGFRLELIDGAKDALRTMW
jgi:hypothetical protein